MLADILLKVAAMEAREKPDGEWYPRASLAGPDRCIRQQVYWHGKTPKDKEVNDRIWHIFDDGQWQEELMIQWIEKSGFQIHSRQMEVVGWDGEPKILCHVDGVITDMLGVDRLLECKGLNHFTFQSFWDQKAYPLDYFTQCALGSRGIQQINPAAVEIVLLIKNKNTSGYIEYLMHYDSPNDTLTVKRLQRHTGEIADVSLTITNICADAAAKFHNIQAHVTAGTIPDRPFEPGDWHCDYCSWATTCWHGFVGELSSLAEKVELEPEVEDMLRYYNQLGAELKEQEEEKDKIRDQIKELLIAKGAKRGKAGNYTASLIRTEKSSVKWDDVPLQITRSLDPYREKKPMEQLRVTESKPKEKKK